MSFLKLFVDHNNPDSFVNKLRKKRFVHIQQALEELIAEKGRIKVLDIGGDITYWKNMGWIDDRCSVYILNLDSWIQGKMPEGFYHVIGDALDLPYQRGDFDLVFSNSVIEHVGSREKQQKFADEVRRISTRYIIQTPSQWFPLEPHSLIPFFQFVPHSLRARLIMRLNINYFPKSDTYEKALAVSKGTMMLTKSAFRKLFPDAEMIVERLFGIPKSYTAIGSAEDLS